MTDPNDNLPDDFAFARGLVTGLGVSACIWFTLDGGVWAAFCTVI